jgi:hypothetical protein
MSRAPGEERDSGQCHTTHRDNSEASLRIAGRWRQRRRHAAGCRRRLPGRTGLSANQRLEGRSQPLFEDRRLAGRFRRHRRSRETFHPEFVQFDRFTAPGLDRFQRFDRLRDPGGALDFGIGIGNAARRCGRGGLRRCRWSRAERSNKTVKRLVRLSASSPRLLDLALQTVKLREACSSKGAGGDESCSGIRVIMTKLPASLSPLSASAVRDNGVDGVQTGYNPRLSPPAHEGFRRKSGKRVAGNGKPFYTRPKY